MAQLQVEIEGGDGGSLGLPADETPPRLQYLFHSGAEGGAQLTAARPNRFLASLLLVADRWVVLAPPSGEGLAVNRVAVIGFKALDHGDVVELAGLRLRLSEQRTEALVAGARLIEQRKACPVCQREFAPGDRVLYCPRCKLAHHTAGSPLHEDCWSWNGRCASRPFCGFQQHRVPPSAPREEAR
jgi:Prokaryotic RING finger family 1